MPLRSLFQAGIAQGVGLRFAPETNTQRFVPNHLIQIDGALADGLCGVHVLDGIALDTCHGHATDARRQEVEGGSTGFQPEVDIKSR